VGTALHAEVRALTRGLADRTASAPRELRAISALAEAEFERLEGRPSPDAWESALLRANDARDPWLAAYAGWREAEARLAGRGDRERAELALRAAMERANRLGAAPLRDEMLAFARRARLSVDASEERPPDASTASVRASLGLSERELEVLALVAEGYTNRRIGEVLFITEKTAGHHVSNVLGKLGVASRVEAAALAHRVGLLAELPPTP
jgi:DNA-binding CsgD family transcriptional regulator